MKNTDNINHPQHYARAKTHPSGVECIDIVYTMPFCIGNAFKYVYRAKFKGAESEDYEKAAWYLRRSIDDALEFALSDKTQKVLKRWVSKEKGGRKLLLQAMVSGVLVGSHTCAYEHYIIRACSHLTKLAMGSTK
jgi:Protein of unknwon function (DUF3310)